MINENDPMMIITNMDQGCVPQETVITDVELAHAYVPFQKMCDTFTPLAGLKKGTIFPPLVDVYRWEKGEMRYMRNE